MGRANPLYPKEGMGTGPEVEPAGILIMRKRKEDGDMQGCCTSSGTSGPSYPSSY